MVRRSGKSSGRSNHQGRIHRRRRSRSSTTGSRSNSVSRRSRSRSNNSSGESSAESSAIWNKIHNDASRLWRPGDGPERSEYLREAVALMRANMPERSMVPAKSVMATSQWLPPLPPPPPPLPPVIECMAKPPPGAQPALLPAVLQLPPSHVPEAATRSMAQHPGPPKPSQAPTLCQSSRQSQQWLSFQ